MNNARTLDDFDEAIAYFNQAVEQNPADALAYAGMALAYVTMGHGAEPPPDVWPRARAAAERAIRLDSTLAEGWSALADYKSYGEHDWTGAEQAFRRANELNPSLAMTHFHYSWYLALFGRVEEALAEHRRAQELDPLTPLHTVWIPALYWYADDDDRALREARALLEQYPRNSTLRYVWAESAARVGLHDEAIAAIQEAMAINPSWSPYLALYYAWAGRREEAERLVAELEAEPASTWTAQVLAQAHAALGNLDQALGWMEYDPPHAWVAWIAAHHPPLDPHRQDPRLQALLRQVNLEVGPGDRAPRALPPLPPALAGDAGPIG